MACVTIDEHNGEAIKKSLQRIRKSMLHKIMSYSMCEFDRVGCL